MSGPALSAWHPYAGDQETCTYRSPVPTVVKEQCGLPRDVHHTATRDCPVGVTHDPCHTGSHGDKRTTADYLAEMQAQVSWATLDTHILLFGRVQQRCRRCRNRPVPENWYAAVLCDPCLDDMLNGLT